MTTTIRQTKTFVGGVFDGDAIDLTPDLPTEVGNLIVMVVNMQGDGTPGSMNSKYLNRFDLENSGFEEGANAFAGLGDFQRTNADQSRLSYLVYGPSQPMLDDNDYCWLQANFNDSSEITVEAVLYELTSDVGDIISYASYNFSYIPAGDAFTVDDWMAVATGYDKPRIVLTFCTTDIGTTAPAVISAPGYGTLADPDVSRNDTDSIRVQLGTTDLPTDCHIESSVDAILGFVVAVVEDSRYNTVQHVVADPGNGVNIEQPTDGNLMLLSVWHRGGLPTMAGWSAIRTHGDESIDHFGVTTFWKQAGSSESTYLYPGGSPSEWQLAYREVSGFTHKIKVAIRGGVNEQAQTSSGYDPTDEWFRLNTGIASMPSLPDNDGYFFTAMAWENEQIGAYSLPDPTIHLNVSLLDSGAGWDFMGGEFGVPMTYMGAGPDSSPGPAENWAFGVGAIFVDAEPLGTEPETPLWGRIGDPNLPYVAKTLGARIDALGSGGGLQGSTLVYESDGVVDIASAVNGGAYAVAAVFTTSGDVTVKWPDPATTPDFAISYVFTAGRPNLSHQIGTTPTSILQFDSSPLGPLYGSDGVTVVESYRANTTDRGAGPAWQLTPAVYLPNNFVYDPDNTLHGPNVFHDWSLLVAQVGQMPEHCTIEIPYSVTIPAGEWGMNGATLVGPVEQNDYTNFADGCHLLPPDSAPYTWVVAEGLAMRSQSSEPIIYIPDNSDTQTVHFGSGCNISTAGGAEFVKVETTGVGIVFLGSSCVVNAGSYEPITITQSAFPLVALDAGVFLQDNTLRGPAVYVIRTSTVSGQESFGGPTGSTHVNVDALNIINLSVASRIGIDSFFFAGPAAGTSTVQEAIAALDGAADETLHDIGKAYVSKSGDRVFFTNGGDGSGYFDTFTGTNVGSIEVGTLPVGYRPTTSRRAMFHLTAQVSGGGHPTPIPCHLLIGTDGLVQIGPLDANFDDSWLISYQIVVEGLNFKISGP